MPLRDLFRVSEPGLTLRHPALGRRLLALESKAPFDVGLRKKQRHRLTDVFALDRLEPPKDALVDGDLLIGLHYPGVLPTQLPQVIWPPPELFPNLLQPPLVLLVVPRGFVVHPFQDPDCERELVRPLLGVLLRIGIESGLGHLVVALLDHISESIDDLLVDEFLKFLEPGAIVFEQAASMSLEHDGVLADQPRAVPEPELLQFGDGRLQILLPRRCFRTDDFGHVNQVGVPFELRSGPIDLRVLRFLIILRDCVLSRRGLGLLLEFLELLFPHTGHRAEVRDRLLEEFLRFLLHFGDQDPDLLAPRLLLLVILAQIRPRRRGAQPAQFVLQLLPLPLLRQGPLLRDSPDGEPGLGRPFVVGVKFQRFPKILFGLAQVDLLELEPPLHGWPRLRHHLRGHLLVKVGRHVADGRLFLLRQPPGEQVVQVPLGQVIVSPAPESLSKEKLGLHFTETRLYEVAGNEPHQRNKGARISPFHFHSQRVTFG